MASTHYRAENLHRPSLSNKPPAGLSSVRCVPRARRLSGGVVEHAGDDHASFQLENLPRK